MNKYGYARVSSKEQNLNRQLDALKEQDIEAENIYTDKISGKDFNRPHYMQLIELMQEGDTLVIKSIDRLGRDYTEILEEWRKLVKYKKIEMVVLDMPILNTENQNDLIKTVIADIVLQLLSFVAENERTDIKRRQAEGIAAAKARGMKFGRPAKKREKIFNILREKWEDGKISSRDAANLLKVSHTTFLRWVEQVNKEKNNN